MPSGSAMPEVGSSSDGYSMLNQSSGKGLHIPRMVAMLDFL